MSAEKHHRLMTTHTTGSGTTVRFGVSVYVYRGVHLHDRAAVRCIYDAAMGPGKVGDPEWVPVLLGELPNVGGYVWELVRES